MHKFLEIRVYKSILHKLFNARTQDLRIDLQKDQDLKNPNLKDQIANIAAGRRIQTIVFDSLGDLAHSQLPNGAGYFSGQNHAYLSITGTRVVVSAQNLDNIIKAFDRVKSGEIPGALPDFWRPDYGYRVPGAVSCAYGNKLVHCQHTTKVDYDWCGPHI